MKQILSIVALAMSTAVTDMANAQSSQKKYEDNPWTLVYDGAITKNENGKVNIHPVKYKVNGIDIAANVSLSKNLL